MVSVQQQQQQQQQQQRPTPEGAGGKAPSSRTSRSPPAKTSSFQCADGQCYGTDRSRSRTHTAGTALGKSKTARSVTGTVEQTAVVPPSRRCSVSTTSSSSSVSTSEDMTASSVTESSDEVFVLTHPTSNTAKGTGNKSSASSRTDTVKAKKTSSDRKRHHAVSTNDVEALDKMDLKRLQRLSFLPMDCSFGTVTTSSPDDGVSLHKLCSPKSRPATATVVFVVRRPGCGACRERGQYLSELFGSLSPTTKVQFVGVLQEQHNEEHTLQFYQDYYRFPLYQNSKIFKVLGERKIHVWQLLSSIPTMLRRFHQKNIENTMDRDLSERSWVQGGILVLDRNANLRHVHFENFGEEMEENRLMEAIREAETNPLPKNTTMVFQQQ